MKGEKLNLNEANNGIEPLVEAIAEEDAAQSDLDLDLDDYPEDVGPTPIFEELYNIGVEGYEDLKQAKPSEQLKYLLSLIEAAEADSFYGFFYAHKIFKKIAESDEFSPLIRLTAKIGGGLKEEARDGYHEPSPKVVDDFENYGYSSIEYTRYRGILSPEQEKMNEEEIRSRIDELEKEDDESVDPYQWMSEMTALEFALQKIYFKKNQVRLHDEFPSLPKESELVKVASDAAAIVESEDKYGEESETPPNALLSQVFYKDGHIAINFAEKNFFDLDKDTAICFAAVHGDKIIKKTIEEKLDFALVDIPLKAQLQLLKFMTEANNERFDKLCNVLQKMNNQQLKEALLENFVAVDFGEDFGDALLEIAESGRLNNEEKEKIFDKINSCRESIRQIAELYAGKDDGQFTREYARAANERLTDAIAVFREIAKNGVASADLGWAGTPEFNYESAMEALGYETRSLEIISGVLNDVRAGKEGAFAEVVLPPNSSSLATQRTFYNLYSPDYGYVLLHTRSEGAGSFDPSLEYGKARSRYNTDSTNVGIEASISLITNPVDPFAIPNPYKPDPRVVKNLNIYDPSTMDKVSAIRIDREGRTYGMSADDNRRDPVSEKGMVSVDLAAIGDRADTPSGKIARLISVGGKLREDILQTTSSLNHNTNWFDHEKYGTSSGFGELVKYLDDMVLEWCKNSPPDKDKNNSFAALIEKAKKAARGKRGRKTVEATKVAKVA